MAQKGKLGTKLTLDKVKGNTPLTKEGKCGIMLWERIDNMQKKPFDWIKAILTLFFLISGILIIGKAQNNWFIALGVLLMILGAIESEENRRRND